MKKLKKLISKKLFLVIIILILSYTAFEFGRQIYIVKRAKDLNLVIISIDTLRPDHMGVYGYEKKTTPNIDNFSNNAKVFTNVSTTVPMTHPSFISLMTGYDPLKTRILNNSFSGISWNTKTLATELKTAGYKTAAFITGEPLDQGIDDFHFHIFKYFQFDKSGNEQFRQSSRADYESFIRQASGWLEKNHNTKFFTWIHLMDVHAPYYPPDDLRCKFNSKYCSQISGKSLEDLERLRGEYQKCQNRTVPKERIGLMENLYDGGVASADRITGEILNTLKKIGVLKNTIVVIYGDHGEGFDHNYYFDHRTVLYDSAIKIPLIIYDPLSDHKMTSNVMLQNTDILPTLLDLMSIKDNSAFDGQSFAYLFNRSLFINPFPANRRKYSFSENNNLSKFSVSDGEYKYIYSLPGSCIHENNYEELYNVEKDKYESNNLIDKLPRIAGRLKQVLYEHLAPYNLPSPFIISEQQNNGFEENDSNFNDDIKAKLKSLQY